jgi:hypothetical protein
MRLHDAAIGMPADALDVSSRSTGDLIALDDALKALETMDPRKAQVIELRFLGD